MHRRLLFTENITRTVVNTRGHIIIYLTYEAVTMKLLSLINLVATWPCHHVA